MQTENQSEKDKATAAEVPTIVLPLLPKGFKPSTQALDGTDVPRIAYPFNEIRMGRPC